MLNDVFTIERGLAAFGINVVGRHADIKDAGRKDFVLRVRLNQAGEIASLQPLEREDQGKLWTFRNGNKNSFPVLSTEISERPRRVSATAHAGPLTGLLGITPQQKSDFEEAFAKSKKPADQRTRLIELIERCGFNHERLARWPGPTHKERIRQRQSHLSSLADNSDTAAVFGVFERFLVALERDQCFLESLGEALKERLSRSEDEWIRWAHDALTSKVTVAIDVAHDDFSRDVGDERQIGPITVALNTIPRQSGASGDGTPPCALDGRMTTLHRGPFPGPTLGPAGPTVLFSRNKDVPALRRYGRVGTESFSVGADLVGRLSGTLKRLTAPDYEGKTWKRIPGERLIVQNGKKVERWDLLLASLPAKPDLPLAEDVAGGQEDDEDVSPESGFQQLAERVVGQSQGIYNHSGPENDVTTIIIRRLDKGSHKVIYRRRTSASDFWAAAQNWRAAASNLPKWAGFLTPARGKSGASFMRPPYVTPLSITRLSHYQYVDGGKRRVDVIGVTAIAAFGLFLNQGDADGIATAFLSLLLRRTTTLIAALSVVARRGYDKAGKLHLDTFDPQGSSRRHALRSLAWIGALLYYLHRIKEVYMSGTGFRLGQLLAAADVLHIGYCNDVRDGAIPATLLGNSVFSIAGSNPRRALSILMGRWKPYQAWRDAKAEPKAHDLRISAIAAELAPKLEHIVPSDTFRAELLLGYIAGLPSEGEPGEGVDESHNQSRGGQK